MYKIGPVLSERLYSRQQTSSNNNDPRPVVYISRNKTAITTQRFWEKKLITPTVGTRSSIAVRRPKGWLTGDMVFTAQVENNIAIIRYAEILPNLNKLKWYELTRLQGVKELSLMFDGIMERTEDIVESYTTGEYPYVIYVNTDGSLKALNLNDTVVEEPITISDMAVNVASVRGLYSQAADLDDGIFIFYTNTLGELWETQLLNDEITYLSKIDLLPEGVTSWEDCWASLTFDYRVILQLKGNDGKVHELVSKSRPSGFSLMETIDYNVKLRDKVFFQIGTIPPLLINSYNQNIDPLKVKLVFDSEVYVTNYQTDNVWISGRDNQKVYPIEVFKSAINEITWRFDSSLLGLPRPHTLHDSKYNPCGFGSFDGVSAIIDGFGTQLIGIDKSNAGEDFIDYAVQDVVFSGEIIKAFDGKAYTTENINYAISATSLLSISLIDASFVKAYTTENISYVVTSLSSLGATLLKADGTPI